MNRYVIYLLKGRVVHIATFPDPLSRDFAFDSAKLEISKSPSSSGILAGDFLPQAYDEVQKLNCFSE